IPLKRRAAHDNRTPIRAVIVMHGGDWKGLLATICAEPYRIPRRQAVTNGKGFRKQYGITVHKSLPYSLRVTSRIPERLALVQSGVDYGELDVPQLGRDIELANGRSGLNPGRAHQAFDDFWMKRRADAAGYRARRLNVNVRLEGMVQPRNDGLAEALHHDPDSHGCRDRDHQRRNRD